MAWIFSIHEKTINLRDNFVLGHIQHCMKTEMEFSTEREEAVNIIGRNLSKISIIAPMKGNSLLN